MDAMSDVVVWGMIVLPVLVAAVPAGRLLFLRRREAELGWELAAQKSALAAETAHRIRSEHAAELAHTLHDELGHRLTLAAVETAALRTRVDSEFTADLELLRSSIAGCVEALNRSISDLSDRHVESPLDAAVEQVAEQIRGLGGSVQVDVTFTSPTGDISDLPAAGRLALLAVAQEGCTNALRHAPGAPIVIRARAEHDAVELEVENGTAGDRTALPAAPPGSGRGLQGLTAQVEALGGELKAGPHDDGWRLHARVPQHPVPGTDEVRMDLLQQRRRARWKLVLLPVAVAAVLIALPVAAVLGQAALSTLSPTDYASVFVGQKESAAKARLPLFEMEAPPPQVGSGDCRHHESTFSPFERTDVFEVCFADGQVRSTTIIPAP